MPILMEWAGPDEDGWAPSERVQLKMESLSTLDDVKQKQHRSNQLQIGLEKMRESNERKRRGLGWAV